LNGQDSLKRFDLKTVAAASFIWEGERYTVRHAPIQVFDTWVRQYVETIEDVDTQIWDIFDRWGIVKALLQGNFLTLSQENGTSMLKGRAEVTSSAPQTEQDTAIYAPFGPLSKASQDAFSERARQQRDDEHPLEPASAPTGGRDYPDLEEGE
jgi:hypothetical protein